MKKENIFLTISADITISSREIPKSAVWHNTESIQSNLNLQSTIQAAAFQMILSLEFCVHFLFPP